MQSVYYCDLELIQLKVVYFEVNIKSINYMILHCNQSSYLKKGSLRILFYSSVGYPANHFLIALKQLYLMRKIVTDSITQDFLRKSKRRPSRAKRTHCGSYDTDIWHKSLQLNHESQVVSLNFIEAFYKVLFKLVLTTGVFFFWVILCV